MTGQDPAETFRLEAGELLERLEQALLDLERSPGNRELVDSAFRALHTIKGSGAMFGFDQVAAFTHDFETAFDRVRKGLVPASRELVSVGLAAQDHIRTLIEDPARADPGVGAKILADLHQVVALECGTRIAAAAAPPPAPPLEPGATTYRLKIRFAPDVLVNGTDPLRLLDELRELGSCEVSVLVDALPPLGDLQAEACYFGWEVVLTTTHPRSAIDDVFIFVLDDMELSVEDVGTPATAPEPAQELRTAAEAPAPAPAGPSQAAPEPGRGSKEGASIRVQAERLDQLMDRVGELVIAQARLSQIAQASRDLNIKAVAEEIERLASGLRDTTMGIRMVPIGSLFGRFRRLVHDLARDLGKPVELVTAGEDTELDKTMIERLADPLVHIIRNAIDHGLERPEGRSQAGKPEVGTVRLVARHSGAEVLISVSDDGKGLDRDRIRAKAEEQGLLAPGAVISDAELFQLLFHPGFSTAQEISALSGRGVGMDVVKRTIESLRGTIDLSTTPGHGTEVTLRLPLTLAIIEGLLVRVAEGRYVIPLSSIEECVELTAAEDRRSDGRSFLKVRGELVPFLRLRDLFAVSGDPDPHQKVVIVWSGEARVGLVVDQIIGSHQTVIKSLSRLQADAEAFSGATILGDGSVSLILDVPHLIELGQKRDQVRHKRLLEVA